MAALAFTNPRVQELRRLLTRRRARHDERRFVVEGPVLAAEAVAAGWRCLDQYVPTGSDAAVPGAGEVHELAPGVLERVGSTEHPRAPLVVVEIPPSDPRPLERFDIVLALDRVADPGNLGTILRSAEAAGAEAVVLTPGSVDPFNPKVVRSSAGALFHVPVITATLAELGERAGFRRIGTTSHAGAHRAVVPLAEADLSGRIAIVLGSEATGLPGDWMDGQGPIDDWVAIPHHGRAESLNVAMAATVLAFEVARRRDGVRRRPGAERPRR